MTSFWRYVVILPWFKAPICCISQLHFYLYYSIFWKSHKMTLTSHVTFWFFEKKSWPMTLTFLKKIFSPWLVTWLFDYFLKKDVTHDFDFWLVFWENDRLWQFLQPTHPHYNHYTPHRYPPNFILNLFNVSKISL